MGDNIARAGVSCARVSFDPKRAASRGVHDDPRLGNLPASVREAYSD